MGGITEGIFGSKEQTQRQSNVQRNEPWAPQIPYILEMFKRAQGGLDAAPPGQWLNEAAAGQLGKTLGGQYLYGNPESQKAVDAITTQTMNRVMPSLDSKFAAGGRYGSGLHKQALGQQVADISAGEMAKNYNAERNRMVQGAGMAPGLSNAMDWRQQRLMDFARLIGGNYGGTSSSTGEVSQQMSRNPFAGLFGGAMAGGRFAGLPGAGIGGLLGLLGL